MIFNADSASDFFKKILENENIKMLVTNMEEIKASIYRILIACDTGVLEKSKNNWHGIAIKNASFAKYSLLSNENKENFALV